MNKQYYTEYYHLERSHWWFKARLEILEALLKENINKPKYRILNAGVATGATTTMLEKYGDVTSLEYDKDCCEFLEKSVGIDVINGSLTELPFEDETFDMVCAFDVIEHIENDGLAVEEIHRVLKDGGYVFLTVPTFSFLWSQHDEINHHFRRYTLKTFQEVVESRGIKVTFKSYFNFFLFLPIFAIRIMTKVVTRSSSAPGESSGSDFEYFQSNKILDRFLYQLFRTEKKFLKRGIMFPVGVSALLIGMKATGSPQ